AVGPADGEAPLQLRPADGAERVGNSVSWTQSEGLLEPGSAPDAERPGDEVLEAPVPLHVGPGPRGPTPRAEGPREPVGGAKARDPVAMRVLGMADRADGLREAVLGAHLELAEELLV